MSNASRTCGLRAASIAASDIVCLSSINPRRRHFIRQIGFHRASIRWCFRQALLSGPRRHDRSSVSSSSPIMGAECRLKSITSRTAEECLRTKVRRASRDRLESQRAFNTAPLIMYAAASTTAWRWAISPSRLSSSDGPHFPQVHAYGVVRCVPAFRTLASGQPHITLFPWLATSVATLGSLLSFGFSPSSDHVLHAHFGTTSDIHVLDSASELLRFGGRT